MTALVHTHRNRYNRVSLCFPSGMSGVLRISSDAMSPASFSYLPLWVQILILAVAAVYGFLLLCVPFAVFGVKGRLSELELHLEEMRSELRSISHKIAQGDMSSAPPKPTEWSPPTRSMTSREAVAEQKPAAPRFGAVGRSAVQGVPSRQADAGDTKEHAPLSASFVQMNRKTPETSGSGEPVFRLGSRRRLDVETGNGPEASSARPDVMAEEAGAPVMPGKLPWQRENTPLSRDKDVTRGGMGSGDAQRENGRMEPVLRWPATRPHDDDLSI